MAMVLFIVASFYDVYVSDFFLWDRCHVDRSAELFNKSMSFMFRDSCHLAMTNETFLKLRLGDFKYLN